jgi:hypothetical protein
VVDANINGHTAKMLIDSGCEGNFMSPSFIQKAGIPTEKKENSYRLYTFDDLPTRENEGLRRLSRFESELMKR